MQMPTAYPANSLPTPFAARTVAAAGLIAWMTARVARVLRLHWRGVDRHTMERASVGGLNERMLKDIGASPWLVAEAAARSRDMLRSRLDAELY